MEARDKFAFSLFVTRLFYRVAVTRRYAWAHVGRATDKSCVSMATTDPYKDFPLSVCPKLEPIERRYI